MLFRNYASDEPGMLRDVYTAICKGLDELQKDFDGVPEEEMMKFVMKETKGCVNPMKLKMILKEFER